MTRLALLLPLLLTLSGCEAGKIYRRGKSLEESNQDIKAAETYLDTLDVKADHRRASKALDRMAEDAWNKLLKNAEEHEAAGRFPEALGAYQRLAELTRRLDRYELLDFKTINVDERVEAMANASAEERYRAAEAAVGAGRWASAVKEYSEALAFKSDYKDSTPKLALSYYSWAGENLSRDAYRDAAEHYAAAHRTVAGYKDAAAQAAKVYAALGQHFKEQGACRQAVRDLRQAQSLVDKTVSAADMEAAMSCATSRVGVAVFTNPTNVSPGGLAVGDLLSEGVLAALPRGATEFVRAEASNAGAIRKLLSWTGPVYLVSGKLLQVKVDGPRATANPQTLQAEQRVPCPPGAGEAGALCVIPATVTYAELHSTPSVTLEVQVTVQDIHSGATVLTDKAKASAGDDVSWVEGVSLGGTPAPIARDGDDLGLILPSWLLDKMTAPHDVRPPDALARDALGQLAGAVAGQVRPVVDAEPAVKDPAKLVIK